MRYVEGEDQRVTREWIEGRNDDIGKLVLLLARVRNLGISTNSARWIFPLEWKPERTEDYDPTQEDSVFSLPITWADVKEPYIAIPWT